MAQRVHAVGVIFENTQGEVLVLKRHPRDPEGTLWGLPGGKIEPDEPALTAAIREVHEEVGYAVRPENLTHLKTYRWDREDLDLFFEVFRAFVQSNAIVSVMDKNEHTEYAWLKPNDLLKRDDLMQGLYPILKDAYNLTGFS